MSSYLLLRNNKESGPFLKEELVQFGLKPYDLIWIQGKSAAWRYPSEIPELKEHAPTIEEQPYDRFYKKETAFKEIQNEQKPPVIEIQNNYKDEIEEKYEAYLPKKNISVIMPERPEFQKSKKADIAEKPTSRITIKEEHPQVETKFSQPLDEIKEMYIRQLQQRKHKTAQKKWIIKRSKQAAVVLAIIGIGFFAGLLMKSKDHTQKNNNDISNQNTAAINQQASSNNATADSFKTNETIEALRDDNKVPDHETTSNESLVSSIKDKMQEKNSFSEKKDEPDSKTEMQPAKNSFVVDQDKKDPSLFLENDNKRSAEKLSETETNEISKLVSLKSNNYKLKAFGGFQNLELTVQNDSKYALDNVLVELQYLKINDKPAQIEHIKFQSIAPGGSLTIRVPDNNRGAKVIYKIVRVEPKDISSSTAGL